MAGYHGGAMGGQGEFCDEVPDKLLLIGVKVESRECSKCLRE